MIRTVYALDSRMIAGIYVFQKNIDDEYNDMTSYTRTTFIFDMIKNGVLKLSIIKENGNTEKKKEIFKIDLVMEPIVTLVADDDPTMKLFYNSEGIISLYDDSGNLSLTWKKQGR